MKVLENPSPRTDWKIGDTAWYKSIHAYDGTIHSGTVRSFGQYGATMKDDVTGGFVTLPFTAMFDSAGTASDVLAREHRKAVDEYKDEIPDTAGLVIFAYTHEVCRCEEYTDWAAREAYRERAIELLGLSLPE